MITFVVQIQVRPENAAAFESIMDYVVSHTRNHESGVAYYAFAKSVQDPNSYLVVEVYRDAAAHAAHMQTAWVQTSLPKASRLIEGKPDIRQYVSPGIEPILLARNRP